MGLGCIEGSPGLCFFEQSQGLAWALFRDQGACARARPHE